VTNNNSILQVVWLGIWLIVEWSETNDSYILPMQNVPTSCHLIKCHLLVFMAHLPYGHCENFYEVYTVLITHKRFNNFLEPTNLNSWKIFKIVHNQTGTGTGQWEWKLFLSKWMPALHNWYSVMMYTVEYQPCSHLIFKKYV
jgi:hypothetical protein